MTGILLIWMLNLNTTTTKLDKTDRKKIAHDSMGTFGEVCHQRLCVKVSVNKIVFFCHGIQQVAIVVNWIF